MSALDKSQLRKAAFAARKAAHGAGLGPLVTAALLAEIGPVTGAIIAGYMPIRTEVDPQPAMIALARGNRVCVPVIIGPNQALRFREWHDGADMVEGPFGAQVPAAGDWLVPQIVIVPLVGFDPQGNRLGYGGGYYDRSLQALRAANPDLRAIGLAYGAQELAAVPTEPTDERLDAVVTEAGRIAPRPMAP